MRKYWEGFSSANFKITKIVWRRPQKNISIKADIVATAIAPKEMVAMKADMGIAWKKVKCMAR